MGGDACSLIRGQAVGDKVTVKTRRAQPGDEVVEIHHTFPRSGKGAIRITILGMGHRDPISQQIYGTFDGSGAVLCRGLFKQVGWIQHNRQRRALQRRVVLRQ